VRFFRCGHQHFLVQKNLDFSKFSVCPHGQGGKGGLSQYGHFSDKEGLGTHLFVEDDFFIYYYGPYYGYKLSTVCRGIR